MSLILKGSYEGGVKALTDSGVVGKINKSNADLINETWKRHGPFDGVLAGNIDLLGLEVINELLRKNVSVLHHIGFINPPYEPKEQPKSKHYKLVAASHSVGRALQQADYDTSLKKEEAKSYLWCIQECVQIYLAVQ